jgi:molybdopterin synthase sulfur carrier subunit
LNDFQGGLKLNIEIRLFANLAKFLPPDSKNKRAKITVKDDITIEELLNELNIPKNTTNVIMLNGVHQKIETKLNDGDVVSVIPPVTGG